jgi:hypothetical protein
MKQQKTITHNHFNGENTPVEALNDDLGDMLYDYGCGWRGGDQRE